MTDEIEYMAVGSLADFPPGAMRVFKIEGEEVLVLQVAGDFYALSNYCTHVGAPLSDGYLNGCELICGYHLAGFDLKTGEVTQGPGYNAVATFKVRVVGDEVQVEHRQRESKRPPHLRFVSLREDN